MASSSSAGAFNSRELTRDTFSSHQRTHQLSMQEFYDAADQNIRGSDPDPHPYSQATQQQIQNYL